MARPKKRTAEAEVIDTKRQTRRKFNADEKIRRGNHQLQRLNL